jgi:hypothetical protein
MDALNQLAEAIRQRNEVDDRIASIVGRPTSGGALDRFVACRIFQIGLDDPDSDVRPSVGRFCEGPLTGRSVAIQWTTLTSRTLDITYDSLPDYVLVMAGSGAARATSAAAEAEARPWQVERVYLFDVRDLLAGLGGNGAEFRSTTAIDRRAWQAAEIYPRQRSARYLLSGAQRHALELFGPKVSFG